MISNYILATILFLVGFIVWLVVEKILENESRCCGNCVYYPNCWGCNDTYKNSPACNKFKKREGK